MVEQRYRAVLEVLNGSPVTEVATRYGVSRQSIYTWKARHAAGGYEALRETSRRPHSSPTRLPPEVEARVCEMRRAHPRWGARRIAHELAREETATVSRATVHRVLSRNGLIRPQEQRHPRKYKRWQREAPMHLWQLDLVGGIFLADGRECKMLTGIDDHSRYVVVAEVLAVPSGRAVVDAFVRAMRIYGVPAEVLTDNGKQFTGRFTRTGPAEVLFERVCRENGVNAKLTKPYSPTTTGKIERWHQTLRRELLDSVGPFADLPTAQEAITQWVRAYNSQRPHQALNMATPASLFRPASQPDPAQTVPAPRRPGTQQAASALSGPLLLAPSAGAVEFDTVVAASGHVNLLRDRRVRVGTRHAGTRAHVWVDEHTVHIFLGGELTKTTVSHLDAEDLHVLTLRGARPAGPPPATAAAQSLTSMPDYTVVEVDRSLDHEGKASLGGNKVKIGPELAKQKVTLRLDGHLLHVVHNGLLAKTLPSPLPADQRHKLHGARLAQTELPPAAPEPIKVERKVPRDGVVMVTRQRLRVGRTYAGKIVTIYVEDTHFRVTLDGTELALHPRKEQRPVTRWKAKIHAPKL
ncbi:hypothetical protein B1C81_37120 [Streptomyces sp. HG99]|nr:hypothetical protein B1C81_37120 [Streptomyces sp. HG99]